jgi:hypothetical protein
MNISNVGGELTTGAVLVTKDGKKINLGDLDKRVGIRADVFGKKVNLTVPWTPKLWFYKHITYRHRLHKQRKGE